MIFNRAEKCMLNGVECEILAANNNGDTLLIAENDGNLVFAVGSPNIENNNIIASRVIGFTVTEKEMTDYIHACCTEDIQPFDISDITKVIRKKYYKIPTYLAELIAYWYVGTYKCC